MTPLKIGLQILYSEEKKDFEVCAMSLTLAAYNFVVLNKSYFFSSNGFVRRKGFTVFAKCFIINNLCFIEITVAGLLRE